MEDLPSGRDVIDTTRGLLTAGFQVSRSSDGEADAIARAIGDFMAVVPEADRLAVVLSGRFATDGTLSWYLTRDARPPTLLGLDETAISVESIMQILARQPSRALLLLGVDPAQDAVFDPWLREGLGPLEIPQGVTVLTATPRAIAEFMAEELEVSRGDLSRLVAQNGDIRAEGYLPRGFVFIPSAAEVAPLPAPAPNAETALWQGAVALDTIEAYRDYLGVYPRGRYEEEARQGIAAILSEPGREARLIEESLRLDRDARRAIQRDLALLDFNPRGIDGVFGPGTRGAITNWQQQNGFAQTSYLDAEQVARLDAQATRRAGQIESEAERQRQAARAADDAYWEESGEGDDEAGLRAYLERFPDGVHAEEAADRLALIEEDKRRTAAGADRAAWDAARDAGTVRAYRRYVEAFPEGRFVEDARARVATLAEESGLTDAIARMRQAEDALGLNALTARVIESRLEGLGLEPGVVDGTFDADTRRALRNFQRDRGLPASGYLDESTLVRLLADTLGQALGD